MGVGQTLVSLKVSTWLQGHHEDPVLGTPAPHMREDQLFPVCALFLPHSRGSEHPARRSLPDAQGLLF